MKILDAELKYWSDTQFSNSPSVKILVDRVPEMADFRYDWKSVGGSRIYYAELDGFVSYFAAHGPFEEIETEQHGTVTASKQDRGYAGRHFPLKMTNGETHLLRGPWSSNSASVRETGFPTCVEVSYTDDPDAWERGHTFYSGAVNRSAMTEISLALPKDDPMHAWIWAENEYGHLMPALVKSTHDKLAGRIYRLTEE